MIFKTKSGQQNHFTASVLAFDTSSFIDGNIEQKNSYFLTGLTQTKKKNHETHRLYIIFYMILFSV